MKLFIIILFLCIKIFFYHSPAQQKSIVVFYEPMQKVNFFAHTHRRDVGFVLEQIHRKFIRPKKHCAV